MTSSYRQTFLEHPLWISIEETSELATSCLEEADDQITEALRFSIQILQLAAERKEGSSEIEVSPSMLNKSFNQIAHLRQLLSQAGTPINLSTLNTSNENLVESFSTWPALRPKHFLSGADAALDKFIKNADSELLTINKTINTVKTVATGLELNQQSLESRSVQENQRVNEALATFTSSSSDRFRELLDETDQALESKLNTFETSFQAFRSGADERLEELRRLEEQAKQLSSSAAAKATGTDFATYSRKLSVNALIYDAVALVVGAAGIAIAAWHLLSMGPSTSIELGLSITRFTVVGSAVGIALAIGSRANQFRKESFAAKQTDLELRNVHTFISTQPPEIQQEILLRMTERLFVDAQISEDLRVPLLQKLRDIRKSETSVVAIEEK